MLEKIDPLRGPITRPVVVRQEDGAEQRATHRGGGRKSEIYGFFDPEHGIRRSAIIRATDTPTRRCAIITVAPSVMAEMSWKKATACTCPKEFTTGRQRPPRNATTTCASRSTFLGRQDFRHRYGQRS